MHRLDRWPAVLPFVAALLAVGFLSGFLAGLFGIGDGVVVVIIVFIALYAWAWAAPTGGLATIVFFKDDLAGVDAKRGPAPGRRANAARHRPSYRQRRVRMFAVPHL